MKENRDFIREIIRGDIEEGLSAERVHTRFPPEPNGYLHIGHAKSICLNFGIAGDFGGTCNLRFDDTNPVKEEPEYIAAIKDDLNWLGFCWGENEYYASDYFELLYSYAEKLIKKGMAYVCDLSAEEIREFRGTLTKPGTESPYRRRSIEENLKLFSEMREGRYADGEKVLRAKIDMAAPNLNMRDPVMYRIMHQPHHRTGNRWCIYPTYDWAHGQSDSIEGITHSICTLEFQDHRPLYNWFIENLGIHFPQQIEFARLNLSHTLMSKRLLLQLVNEGLVDGWDDPRMPTISGMRRRGYPPEAIRDFCSQVGVSKTESTIDIAFLEHVVRKHLNRSSTRVMAVLDPVKIIITNYPENGREELDAVNNPEDPAAGTRKVAFSREIYIEREDFREDPPAKFYRLSPGREVRLRYAYFIKLQDIIRDEKGGIKALHCTYDPATKGGDSPDGRRVKATLHWVDAETAVDIQVNLYGRLFNAEKPVEALKTEGFKTLINPDSLRIKNNCKAEKILAKACKGERFQFERIGYFCADNRSRKGQMLFNLTVNLRDEWKRIMNRG